MHNILYETKELKPISEILESNINLRNDNEKENEIVQELSTNASSISPISIYDNLSIIIDIDEDFLEMKVKDLKKIANYYSISSNRLRKSNLVDKLVEFEKNELNFPIVEKRRRYWQYMYELLNDKQMSSYVHDFM